MGMDLPGLVVDKLKEEIMAFGKSFLSKKMMALKILDFPLNPVSYVRC